MKFGRVVASLTLCIMALRPRAPRPRHAPHRHCRSSVDYNLYVCVSNNLYSVLLAFSASSSTCSFTDLLALESDTQILNLVSLIEDIVASPSSMSSLVYSYMADTSSSDMNDFCTTLNTAISPCLLSLLPTLLPVFEADTTCCSEVSDLIDLIAGFSVHHQLFVLHHHMRPLIESIQDGFEYFFDDTTVDILNGMIDFSATGRKFVDSVPGTASCTWTDTCSDPAYLIAQQTNDIEDITCTMVDKCNSAGTVCSSVCEKGTASISSWLNQTLAYQRNLAFSGQLCYAQIPSTHNSAITLADGYGNRDQLFNANLDSDKSYSYLKTNNHVLSLTDQLGIGIRWIEIDTHYFLDDFHTGHLCTILWGPELLGCFPSISGIKTTDEVTTRSSMEEVMDWLEENPTEFVVVYMDTGSDISRLDKHDDLNTINEFIDAGYQVLLLANEDTGLAYGLSRKIDGLEIYGNNYFLRSYQAELRYISLSDEGVLTEEFGRS
ncbi:PLC-like phosphodiesterase, TIM beta/alpha-barrel domain [Phytophthora cactorum]|nr:PLC-like phosphodiesterase, TIM beta/alpha-barrel domain [Phytophthora cactorum]